ncbi:S4 domain-containing protein YaaA [Cytobacillus horneckiae]|uniref:S4 domain-containing protein YaaA n=1 Tax=Cytobacillus horneckiae TaxID=549687 RepID=UPI0019D22F69|nr:S4 domain-containing protein YaaA [Cytobacillus horneckiae]MBN6889949.1 S4 domain-containing protein YaaA [Cytobacillus horneckiae]MCM3179435.1 S4 domain-containing protein YaaA [Cytobacillus horneckiae]
MNKVKIDTEYITLGQFLKAADIISTGGMAKWFLSEYDVFVNGEQDQRRGRKLRTGDQIEIPDHGTYIVTE